MTVRVGINGFGRTGRALASDAGEVEVGAGGLQVETTTAGKPGVAGMDAADYATVGELVLFILLISLTSAGNLVEARPRRHGPPAGRRLRRAIGA